MLGVPDTSGLGASEEAPASGLGATGRRLGKLGDHLGFAVGEPPPEAGWHPLVPACSELVDRMAEVLVRGEGRRDVAGSCLAGHLSSPLVSRTVGAVVLDRRCPDPAGARAHLHPEGWFDAVAFAPGAGAAVAGDAMGREPGVAVLPDVPALGAWWAERLAATVAPLLAAARSRFPFGVRGMWGAVADEVAATAAGVDRGRGGDGAAGCEEAERLLDALAERVPVPLERPSPVAVRWSGGTSWLTIRGTCCLYYRTQGGSDRSTGDGFCATCPLVPGRARRRRLAAWLEQQGQDR